jgi:GT2 family glycosyltransferase
MPSNSNAPTASVVIPTRARPDYLDVALASISPQVAQAGGELVVVDDAGPSETVRALCERFGARYEPHARPRGLNVARNTGVARSAGELVAFVDDDVEACDGWLAALLAAARAHPNVDVFTGPIVARLEGRPPRTCGREGSPITSLDLGPADTITRYAWGANMAIRRSALERVGPFDVSLEHGGDEQEWQERLNGGGALYVAAAALHHRRSARDAGLRALCRAARARGRASRRFDARRGGAPPLGHELRTLAGCVGHVVRYRCPAGLTMVAHALGRVEESIRPNRSARTHARTRLDVTSATAASNGHGSDDFLSGESGTVGGIDGLRRAALDVGTIALEVGSGRRRRLDGAARRTPRTRRVLALCVERPEHRKLVQGIRTELARSRHEVELCLTPPGDRGKFENLNLLLDSHPPHDRDWLLVVDDDIVLPRGFLDRFLFLAERFRLDLAQPAHRRTSHAAWQVTRRRRGSVVRETQFVEIGPLTAFARSTFSTLLPFPELRMGWGLDAHWAAVARAHGWRCGVVDAAPIVHRSAPAASSYSREQALAEARAFLERRPYLSASEAGQTLVIHRRW